MAQNGTARLSGHVRDTTGKGLPQVLVELRAEKPPGRYFKTQSDDSGSYMFTDLPNDEYTLKLQSPGFASLTVRSVLIEGGQSKTLPSLQLSVNEIADCGGHADIDYLRLMASKNETGSFRGRVMFEESPKNPKGKRIKDVAVSLLCGAARGCPKTRTDSNGEFAFDGLKEGSYAVEVRSSGFYPLLLSGFAVREGFESVFWPISLVRCFRGDCNPARRPPKPVAVCE